MKTGLVAGSDRTAWYHSFTSATRVSLGNLSLEILAVGFSAPREPFP